MDFSSVLSDLSAPLPSYRFTSLYPQALDFVNAVRAYGAALQAALEKSDAGALALLQQTLQQQLLVDGNQILEWQVQQAQSNIDALNQTLALAQQKYNFNNSQILPMQGRSSARHCTPRRVFSKAIVCSDAMAGGGCRFRFRHFTIGAAGFGGTPVAYHSYGGAQMARRPIWLERIVNHCRCRGDRSRAATTLAETWQHSPTGQLD